MQNFLPRLGLTSDTYLTSDNPVPSAKGLSKTLG